MIRKIFIYCCLLISVMANAQQKSTLDKATALLSEASNVFKRENLLMNVSYTYANEQTPDVIIDSLQGSMLISGDNYRGELGNTLTVKNGRYSVIVFRDEKLLYVSKFNTDKGVMSMSPVQIIADAIKATGVKECKITEQKELILLRFDFPPQLSYRYMQVEINKRDNSISSLSYVVKKSALFQEESGDKDTYAKVRTKFNYHVSPKISPADFDEKQFFTQKDNSLVPAAAYNDYEVFIGSPSN